jgi:selenocysteine lyase/cysteine desulfurase
MSISRRDFVAGVAVMGSASLLPAIAPAQAPPVSSGSASALPRKADFAIPSDLTYINSAYIHPMPIGVRDALGKFAEMRSTPGVGLGHFETDDPKKEFAALINARPSEISYVPSTSAGENLVVNGLGIVGTDANVVTDALHFDGALLHLGELKRRSGLDVRIVMPRGWRIDIKDLERVVDRKTKLIEISLVAMDNGFQHDLKAVCDLAHAHGAYVYADIIQAAGNTPIDVRESGVDFCACSSFKWLMGDFGLGFLFVREGLLDTVLHRTQYGYYEAKSMESHFLPNDKPGDAPYTWQLGDDASSHFEVGTQASGVAHALAVSLPYIRSIGVENIHAYRQPLLKKLHAEMPRLGFESITPPESTSAVISFRMKDRADVVRRLREARINARVTEQFLRLSPSVFNDMSDVNKLLEALA